MRKIEVDIVARRVEARFTKGVHRKAPGSPPGGEIQCMTQQDVGSDVATPASSKGEASRLLTFCIIQPSEQSGQMLVINRQNNAEKQLNDHIR
jgi:hypothetical protein